MTVNVTHSANFRWRALQQPVTAWIAFAVVHVVLLLEANTQAASYFGDVHLYAWWILTGIHDGYWPVIHADSVYPVGALIPMVIPTIVAPEWSSDFESYRVAYELLVVLVNAIAMVFLMRHRRHSGQAARVPLGVWWWLGFLVCLGPIVLTRLDGIAAGLSVIALMCALPQRQAPSGRVALAASVATVGAWIKIAPGAAWLALAVTSKHPLRRVIVPGLLATAALLVPAGVLILAEGGGVRGLSRLTSFLDQQQGRGLQIESVAATYFSVSRLWSPDHVAEFNRVLNTWEIVGPGTSTVGTVVGLLLVLVVVLIALLARRASRHLPTSHENTARIDLMLWTTLALTVALIVFNKVGSPQFIVWLAPPVAVALTGLDASDQSRYHVWLRIGGVLWIVALLTHVLYPLWYGSFLSGDMPGVADGAIRNVLLLVMCGWTIQRLIRFTYDQSHRPTA